MDLKELLGEDLYNQVMAKAGDKHKIAVVSDGNYFPKEKWNEVNEAKKKAEADLKDRDKQLEDLKKSAGDNEELKKQIDALQNDNKAAKDKYEAELRDLKINTALKLALAGEVHDADLVAGLIDKAKIKVKDDGAIESGLDDQVKALRESKAFLFVEKTDDKQPRFKGSKPPEGGGSKPNGKVNPWKKETWNLTEQGRIYRDDPELAAQLKAAAK
ncbi:phage scaffolding protein [Paenibacillus puldeungensis]|uniref:Phage scaffolding protein n=1 Tax=Paenibacillus puldeungensis TaxID=696536 RepID=A0ABW3S5B2_9BACL